MNIQQNNKIFTLLRNGTTIHKLFGIMGLIFLLSWFAYNFNHGELIQVSNGLGWDGGNYAVWAQEGTLHLLKNKSLNVYHTQRIFPSTIVHYVSKLAGYDIATTSGVIHAFEIYNSILIFLSAIFLWLIAKHFRWKLSVLFVGYAAVFFNFAILKWSVYYPTLADVTAFFLGIATFYFYLKNRVVCLIITTIAASFTFPTMLYAALPLIIFPCKHYNTNVTSSFKTKGMLVGIFSLFLVVLAFCITPSTGDIRHGFLATINVSLLPISIICLLAYFSFSLYYLFDLNYIWTNIKSNIFLLRIVLAFTLVIVIHFCVNTFSSHAVLSHSPPSIASYILLIFQMALVRPFTSIVSHIMFFGPGILLVIFLWRKMAEVIKEHGFGMILFICFYILVGVDPESRHLINAVPVFMILACETLNRRGISWKFTYFFVIISLIISRFWVVINYVTWPSSTVIAKGFSKGILLKFPMQMLFMNSGPWLSDSMYWIFLAVVILTAICIFSMLQLDKIHFSGKTYNAVIANYSSESEHNHEKKNV